MDSDSSTELGLYIAYGAIITIASVSIYLGSTGSVQNMKKPDNAPKSKKSRSPLEDSDDEEDPATKSLTSDMAYMFPVIGSVALFSLHSACKYIDKEYIDYVLTVYFSIMGCVAVTKTSMDLVKNTVPTQWLKCVEKYKITISKRSKNLSYFHFTLIHFVIVFASIALAVCYMFTKHWIVSNLFGIALTINAIQLLFLDSFQTGIILLGGLFFYDIFWVFYKPAVVSVITQLDTPIKLLWPRNAFEHFFESNQLVMLGLGDIVIPGIFIALALRHDRHLSWKLQPVGHFRSTRFYKPYFTACFTAYVFGLIVTITVMNMYDMSQPALLYLSPACILSVFITAFVRGESSSLFSYNVEEKQVIEPKKKKRSEPQIEKQFKEEVCVPEEIQTPVKEPEVVKPEKKIPKRSRNKK